ncbi:Putative serine/threonine-protein kinase-like protein CCR3 [Linum grandiflorum]
MVLKFTPLTFLLVTTVSALISTSTSSSLSSTSTIAVTPTYPPTVCVIVANQPTQYIKCLHNGQTTSILPHFSFESISAGKNVLCGLVSGGLSLFCWDILIDPRGNANFQRQRIYNDTIAVTDLSVGITDQVCAREVDSGKPKCWRGSGFPDPGQDLSFKTVTSGDEFVCGILKNDSTVRCWGYDSVTIQSQFGGLKMESLVASKTHVHVCGNTNSGDLVCKGSNEAGQLNVPESSNFDFYSLAAGPDFNCAIKEQRLTCWGVGVSRVGLEVTGLALDLLASVIASSDYICGLNVHNLTVSCWGSGWPDFDGNPIELPLGEVIPGPCVQSCPCDPFTCSDVCGKEILGSGIFCSGNGVICESCPTPSPSFDGSKYAPAQ